MSPETFRRRIEAGRCNNHIGSQDDREWPVSVWKHAGRYVLTWEECPAGQQFDESAYTRDERHHFASVAEVEHFLEQRGLRAEDFGD